MISFHKKLLTWRRTIPEWKFQVRFRYAVGTNEIRFWCEQIRKQAEISTSQSPRFSAGTFSVRTKASSATFLDHCGSSSIWTVRMKSTLSPQLVRRPYLGRFWHTVVTGTSFFFSTLWRREAALSRHERLPEYGARLLSAAALPSRSVACNFVMR